MDQERLERNELNRFGPDDPYDFKVPVMTRKVILTGPEYKKLIERILELHPELTLETLAAKLNLSTAEIERRMNEPA